MDGKTRGGLRVLVTPFVVGVPGGVRVRTRLRPTAGEQVGLERIGVFLGSLSRRTLAGRVRLGHLSTGDQAAWRAQTKRELTVQCSSRWAGAITRTAADSYHLGMRALAADVRSLEQASSVIGARMGVVAGTSTPGPTPRSRGVRGYANSGERFAKSRRRAHLTTRLEANRARLVAGRPRIVAGGRRLWLTRNNLDRAGLTHTEWARCWADERMFLTADGETGKRFGNETIRVTDTGTVHIKVPTALVGELGVTHLVLATAVGFTHRGIEWAGRVEANQAIRYDIHRDHRGRWYLDASWTYPPPPTVSLEVLRTGRTLGVDLNAGHADAAVIDAHGNVAGTPVRIDYQATGPATCRDAHLRHLVTRLVHHAKTHKCASISIEDLGFTEARTTGRETMGRGKKGKRFRRTLAGIPTARFRARLVAMAATAGLAVIAVDPAYTTAWAKQHWLAPLQACDPSVDAHKAAAVVIGRRGQGHKARRKPVGPRARQRTRPGQPHRTASRVGMACCRHATRAPQPHEHHQDGAGARESRKRKRRRLQHRPGGKNE